MEIKRLFWGKVQVLGLDDCWEWIAAKYPNGYGQFATGARNGLSQQAHRTAYLLTHGEITKGLDIRHSCHNRACCNPGHLSSGTRQDNMDDQLRDGKRPYGNQHHRIKLTEAQVLEIRERKEDLDTLSKEYKVSKALVSLIKNKKSRRKL